MGIKDEAKAGRLFKRVEQDIVNRNGEHEGRRGFVWKLKVEEFSLGHDVFPAVSDHPNKHVRQTIGDAGLKGGGEVWSGETRCMSSASR